MDHDILILNSFTHDVMLKHFLLSYSCHVMSYLSNFHKSEHLYCCNAGTCICGFAQ